MQNWWMTVIGMCSKGIGKISDIFSNGKPESRYIDPENDTYPPPLMSRGNSYKVKHGIMMPVFFFQTKRIKALIRDHQDDHVNDVFLDNRELIARENYEKYSWLAKKHETFDEYYEHYCSENQSIYNFSYQVPDNILSMLDELNLRYLGIGEALIMLCGPNMPSNLPYEGNEYIWNETFMAIIETLTQENLMEACDYRHYNMRVNTFEMALRNKRFLWALIFLHYGFKPDMEKIEDPEGFWASEKIEIVINSNLEENSLCALLEDYTCPLTCNPIECPVILEDGNIYEKDMILKWLETHDTSPLTNVKLTNYWMGFDLINNKFVYADRYDLVPESPLYK